jgi:peptide methionine sulfoxide reductase msrA/msrB
MIRLAAYGVALIVVCSAAYLWFVPRIVEKAPVNVATEDIQTAQFAGGCFWCTEADFEKLEGVIEVLSGYAGGTAETATYEQTSSKTTNHREVVQVTYDASKLSFKDLADYHLKHIDPTDNEGQFVDRGFVYSPAIFYNTEAEKVQAEQALAQLNALNVFAGTVAIPVELEKTFYPAEARHQDYYLKKPAPYNYYRSRSGRDQFLDTTWKN